MVRTLHGKTCSPPPIWLMRQAGRYLPEYREVRARAGSFLDLCYSPAMAAEVTLQPIRRYGFDAAILFSDILVVPDALGQKVEFREGEGPVLEPVREGKALAALRPERALDRLGPVFEAVNRIRGALDESTALIGFCGAPWTVATYMVGGRGSSDQAEARLWAYRDPQEFSRLISLLVDVSAAYLARQVNAGAQVLQIFDSWAGSLPDGEFERWCLKPVAAMIARLREIHPRIPVIAFPRGAGARYAGYAKATGADGVGCDTTLTPAWIRDNVQHDAAVQGNLDPLLLVAGGTAMERRIGEILAALSEGPFVFNLGHGIVPQTPPEHVARLVELVRQGR
ncbi:MAG: uroporphyrinogen decarboxylase [Pseudomonadota bacterium]|nr:uroporphyrinogen decarboxylase [Pseudomonadota bacterium]